MRYDQANMEQVPQSFKNAVTQAKTDGKGLLIWGGAGTGKTYCLNALRNQYGNVHFENWVDIAIEARDRISQRKAQGDLIKNICEYQALAIDDLGAENHTDFTQEILYSIVNKYYVAEKKLIIATNLTPEQLAEKYGDRIISRLAEMCLFVKLDGDDRRIS